LAKNRLKSIYLCFKKDVNLPNGLSVEETLEKIGKTNDYILKLELSISRPTKNQKYSSLNDAVDRILGMTLEKAINDGVDFPSFLSNFKFTVLDESNNSVDEDVLDRYEKVTLTIDKDHLNTHSNICTSLCGELADKVNKEYGDD
jgi:hypothetical protein